MLKLKTKSSVKKRFALTARLKVRATQANKQHNMRKRSKRQLRVQRYTTTLSPADAPRVRRYMPYA